MKYLFFLFVFIVTKTPYKYRYGSFYIEESSIGRVEWLVKIFNPVIIPSNPEDEAIYIFKS